LHGRRGKNKKDHEYQLLIRRISGLVKAKQINLVGLIGRKEIEDIGSV
jgi:hypothetical protein